MARFQTITPEQCAEDILSAKSICALTGAGISTAAGIPDFRGPNGLYTSRRYNPERIFDITQFLIDPTAFFEFSRELLEIVDRLQPTYTHRFLSALEDAGHFDTLITQNIDPLHQMAGSRTLIPIHGSYETARCLSCGRTFAFNEIASRIRSGKIPRCPCEAGGVIKPDVVFFGEPVLGLEQAEQAVRRCDLFLVLGSSLQVYPAAWLPQLVPGKIVIINRGSVKISPSSRIYHADDDLDIFFRQVTRNLAGKGLRLDL